MLPVACSQKSWCKCSNPNAPVLCLRNRPYALFSGLIQATHHTHQTAGRRLLVYLILLRNTSSSETVLGGVAASALHAQFCRRSSDVIQRWRKTSKVSKVRCCYIITKHYFYGHFSHYLTIRKINLFQYTLHSPLYQTTTLLAGIKNCTQ